MPKAQRVPLEVIMVPLDRKREIRAPHFPRFPRLYLELLQNREKIKPEFLKEEFVPKYEGAEVVFDKDGDELVGNPINEPFKPSNPSVKSTSKIAPKPKAIDPVLNHPNKSKTAKPILSKANKSISEKDKGLPPPKDVLTIDIPGDVISDELFGDNPPINDPSVKDPLANFLKKSRSIGNRERPDEKERRRSYEHHKDEILQDDRKAPPSLAELADGGAFDLKGGIKDMNRISKKDQDDEQKVRQYLYKFDLLKMSYKGEDIPKFTINSDPEHVARTYDDILRNLSMTDNVNKYKKYLMFGFMGVEALGGNVLGFDMKGFTKQQQIEMSSYDKLLIELGEKNYTPKSTWPVELRLLGMIIMNAAFFVASKMALKATGTDVLTSMNNVANAGVANTRKKTQMSGPNIDLDDIPTSSIPKENSTNTKGVLFVNK
jgi:hypothetical protein